MMRLAILLLLPCLLAGVPVPGAAMPAMQSVIHHCVDPNGTPVYTDRPCASLGAVPAASDVDPPAPGRSTGPLACPRDRKALEQRVADAFRSRDANALAGLMLWRGYSEYGAVHTVHDLVDLMQWPFLGFAGETPAPDTSLMNLPGLPPLLPSTAQSTEAPPQANTLTIRLARPDQPDATFAIVLRAGCLWLEP